MRKKILVITYYWPPSGGAGVQRWLKFAKYLPEFGVDPIILTVDPKFASYPVEDKSLLKEVPEDVKVYTTKTKEIFSAYQKIFRKKGIPYGGFSNEQGSNFINLVNRFIRGNFFIPDPRKGWNRYAYQKAVEVLQKYDIKTVVINTPPHSSQLIGLKLKKHFNINWIADLRDPWTDIYYYKKLLRTYFAKKIDQNFERRVLESADYALVVSHYIKNQFAAKTNKHIHSSIHVIPNGFDHEDFEGHEVIEQKEFVISYTGTLSSQYPYDAFLSNLIALKSKKIPFKFRIIGNVDTFIRKKFELLGPGFEYIPYVSHSDVISYLLKSSIQLLIIPNVQDNHGILTGKMFEYLASKRPVLSYGPVNGDANKILQMTKSGKTFDYSDEKQSFKFLMELYDEWKENKSIKMDSVNTDNYSRRNLTKLLTNYIH